MVSLLFPQNRAAIVPWQRIVGILPHPLHIINNLRPTGGIGSIIYGLSLERPFNMV
jgi:hypothetical protein